MISKQEVEKKYHGMKLETRLIEDKPGEIYEPHKHGEVYLYTLHGSAKLRLDNSDWQIVNAGQEVHILDNQLHEGLAGPEGWTYIFAASQDEMKRQNF